MDYRKLLEDFNSGVLDKRKVRLIMDNDGGYFEGLTDCDDENEKLANECKLKYGSPNGYNDIVDVLNAAGSSCEWC